MLKTTKQPSKNLKPGMLVPFNTTETTTSNISIVLSVNKHGSLFHVKVLTSDFRVYDWYVGLSKTVVWIYE